MNISFEVPGQPAPWGVYRRRRRGQRSSPGKDRMEAYQDTIRLYARQKWGREPPFMGPVKIAVVVYPDVGKTLRGDAINYGKAVEDATQGIVIGNDRQTVEIRATKGEKPVPGGLTVVWAWSDGAGPVNQAEDSRFIGAVGPEEA